MRSNCLVQALTAFLSDPLSVTIHRRGELADLLNGDVPHFYWHDARDDTYYHFTAEDTDLRWWRLLWFEGHIDTFLWHGKGGAL